MVVPEAASEKVQRFFTDLSGTPLATSQWTNLEILSALSRLVRMKLIDKELAANAEAQFRTLIAESFAMLAPAPEDFDASLGFVRRHETGLRAGDALHLAIASRHQADAIYSLDRTFVRAGRLLGLPTDNGI